MMMTRCSYSIRVCRVSTYLEVQADDQVREGRDDKPSRDDSRDAQRRPEHPTQRTSL